MQGLHHTQHRAFFIRGAMKKTTTGPGRPKKPIKRYVPSAALIQLNSHLKMHPPMFAYEKEAFWFILDLFFRLRLYNKDIRLKEDDYIPIASSYFKQHISDNYASYIRVLVEASIVECDGHFSAEEHICLGYKINPEFESKLVCVEVGPQTKIWRAITNKRNSLAPKEKMEPHIKLMKAHFRKIEFDDVSAVRYLDRQLNQGEINLNQYNIRYLSIQALKNKGKSLFFNQNHTNFRVDSNLTNLKRELRNFIVGEDLVQIDLANSQPYLFNFLLLLVSNKNILSYSDGNSPFNPLNPFIEVLLKRLINSPKLDLNEVHRYNERTRSGKIYDLFVSKFEITRDEAKELFLATFYSSNYSKKYAKSKEFFKAEFPTINQLIEAFKRKDHEPLPVAMQNLESEIFIEGIARELCEMGIIPYTVHDSIIIERKHLGIAIQIMENTFIKYFGEIPTFDIKELNPEKLNVIKLHQEITPEQLGIPFVCDYTIDEREVKTA